MLTVVVEHATHGVRSVYSRNVGGSIVHINNILNLFNWWTIITVCIRHIKYSSYNSRAEDRKYILRNICVLKK